MRFIANLKYTYNDAITPYNIGQDSDSISPKSFYKFTSFCDKTMIGFVQK
jgi:hypothetical protein